MSESLADATQLGGTPERPDATRWSAHGRRPRPRARRARAGPGGGERPLRRPHHHPVRRSGGGRRRLVHHPAEVGGQPDRTERRREDHVLQRDHRPLPGDRGHGLPRGQGHHRRQAPPAGGDGAGPDVPEHPAVQPDDRRGERDGGDALPPQGRGDVDHHPHARPAPGGAGGPRHRARAAAIRRHRQERGRARPQPLLRRPAPAGDRPGHGAATRRSCCSTSRPPA